jgi:DNA repair exonuclease SbcCD ATPase subunit
MSMSEDPDRDTALALLAHACDQLGSPNGPAAQASEQLMRSPNAEKRKRDAKQTKSRRVALQPWSWGTQVAATIALTLLSVAGIAWVSLHGRPTPIPITNYTTDVSAKPLDNIASAIDSSGSPPSHQTPSGTVSTPLVASKEPDRLSAQEQTSALLDLRQQIDQLRLSQSQLSRSHAELTQRLKAALETAQNNADRIEELKSTQTQLVREKESLIARLNAGQEQATGALGQLKSTQDQIADIAAQFKLVQDQVTRLAEQKSRPKAIAPARPLVVNSPQRPAPPPSPQLRLPLRTNTGSSPR